MQIDYVEFCGALSALIAAVRAEQEAAAERLQRLAEEVREKSAGLFPPFEHGTRTGAVRQSWGERRRVQRWIGSESQVVAALAATTTLERPCS